MRVHHNLTYDAPSLYSDMGSYSAGVSPGSSERCHLKKRKVHIAIAVKPIASLA